MCEKAAIIIEHNASLPRAIGRYLRSLLSLLLHRLCKIWGHAVWILSTEYVLKGMPNGSAAILLRTLISSILLFLLVLGVANAVDPDRIWQFSMAELWTQFSERIGWLGLIFGAVYTGLYARFSSQWTYLANLYNQIKQVEASTPAQGSNLDKLAEWKAGFIEDAEHLHLACKESFVSIIRAWADEELVRQKYILHTPGGEERLTRLLMKARPSTGRDLKR